MFDSTEIVRMAQELARHSGARQAEIARNVGNADTPGYRARDVAAFADAYRSALPMPARATRDGHMAGLDAPDRFRRVDDARTEPSPNGNSVSIEVEMMKSAEVRQSHGMALAVYKTSLDLMRATLGRGR